MGRGTTSGSSRRRAITRAISLAPELDAAIDAARGETPRSEWIARACWLRLEPRCACEAGLCDARHCAESAPDR